MSHMRSRKIYNVISAIRSGTSCEWRVEEVFIGPELRCRQCWLRQCTKFASAAVSEAVAIGRFHQVLFPQSVDIKSELQQSLPLSRYGRGETCRWSETLAAKTE